MISCVFPSSELLQLAKLITNPILYEFSEVKKWVELMIYSLD